MQEWIQANPQLYAVSFGAFFAVLWVVSGFFFSGASGWRALADRYRTDRSSPEHSRRMQSAQMRWLMNYNHVLTVGSDSEGLYLGMMILFRLGYPPLFIPWRDIEFEEPSKWFFFNVQKLRLGPDRIPLQLRQRVVDFLREPQQRGITRMDEDFYR